VVVVQEVFRQLVTVVVVTDAITGRVTNVIAATYEATAMVRSHLRDWRKSR
jgi:hypothetical protein